MKGPERNEVSASVCMCVRIGIPARGGRNGGWMDEGGEGQASSCGLLVPTCRFFNCVCLCVCLSVCLGGGGGGGGTVNAPHID